VRAREPIGVVDYALTAGELGVSAGQSLIVALLPVLIRRYAGSNFWIGFSVGGEGFFALALPFVAGVAIDRLPAAGVRGLGRHSFLLLGAAPIMAAAIAVLPFLSSYWSMTGVTFAFFAGQHAYVTPLMALIVDTESDAKRARVQGIRSIYRALGLAYGLVGSGLLLTLWRPLPFLIAAALIAVSTSVTVWAERRSTIRSRSRVSGSVIQQMKDTLRQVRSTPAAAWLLAANALWNGAVDGIRPYFFLFALVVIGVSVATTSLGLIALIVTIAASSAVFGKLGDTRDRAWLVARGALFGALAMSAGYFARGPWVAMALLVVAGIGSGAMMTLPYPLFASLMGDEGAGKYSGLFALSVSVGRIGAPMLVGAAIDWGGGILPEYEGYPFMWPAAAVFAIGGWLALRRVRRPRRRERQRRVELSSPYRSS
jgi:MFS family permease